jgi:hypothetical protein
VIDPLPHARLLQGAVGMAFPGGPPFTQ